jgi:hypothetical protein
MFLNAWQKRKTRNKTFHSNFTYFKLSYPHAMLKNERVNFNKITFEIEATHAKSTQNKSA